MQMDFGDVMEEEWIKVGTVADIDEDDTHSVEVGGKPVCLYNLGGEIFAMQQIEAASGARYVAVDDATTSFWSKGDAATLVIRGQAYPSCMQVTAKASPFRTVSRHRG